MNRSLIIAVCILTTSTLIGQEFEGKIIYKNTYESNTKGVSDNQLNSLMGTIQEYVIKGGNYKSSVNGSFNQYQLYRSEENRIYNKFSNAEALFWSDASIEGEKILSIDVKEDQETILGVSCDKLIMKTTKGSYIYFYSSKYPINPTLFREHIFGNWYEFVKRAKSVPLKIIMNTLEFKSISVAIKLESLEVDSSFFDIPELPLKPISELRN
ncbi:hypothetical protein L0P88_10115 [Muricauda sp. SCSIO 64092]|uniref:hypothetical protein n=1 Tax=Allomuricauda sp. SCSIO 64092 TaxID=2908842 RepID=UPI001FF42C23|nr:hypothetical protein [Muricauda sp. SCSIO 64092]UOY08888.1 hypothetical protein L0P88_10115 [Muricauda sp. SCSIO 64092]